MFDLVISGVVAAAAAGAWRTWRGTGRRPSLVDPLRYETRPVLSERQADFFRRLCRALPEFHIFAQVGLPAVIRPAARSALIREVAARRIAPNTIDYAICDVDSLDPVCVILLGEPSGGMRSADASNCDVLLTEAGIPVLRWPGRIQPTEAQLRMHFELAVTAQGRSKSERAQASSW